MSKNKIVLSVTRKFDKEFISGHLFENTTFGKEYEVKAKSSRAGLLIIDDNYAEIWLSNSSLKTEFKVLRSVVR